MYDQSGCCYCEQCYQTCLGWVWGVDPSRVTVTFLERRRFCARKMQFYADEQVQFVVTLCTEDVYRCSRGHLFARYAPVDADGRAEPPMSPTAGFQLVRRRRPVDSDDDNPV